jgi:hypothetical protein
MTQDNSNDEDSFDPDRVVTPPDFDLADPDGVCSLSDSNCIVLSKVTCEDLRVDAPLFSSFVLVVLDIREPISIAYDEESFDLGEADTALGRRCLRHYF